MEDVRKDLPGIIDKIETALTCWRYNKIPGSLKIKEKTRYSLKLQLKPDRRKNDTIDIDLDPAYDILDGKFQNYIFWFI